MKREIYKDIFRKMVYTGCIEIRVLILTNERTRQFMKVSLYHSVKFAKVFQDFFK
jgi:hypothetical protein